MRSGVRTMAALGFFLACVVCAQPLPKFMGRKVIIVTPELDDDGFFPKGPATVCLEGPPERQCYTAPRDYGRIPYFKVVQVEALPALFFTVASGGVSGFGVHFALLQPGKGNSLDDLFAVAGADVSNESQYEFWAEPSISQAPIFLTANFSYGPDESHYSLHRYMISSYVLKHTLLPEGSWYYLDDRYMTVRKYDYTKADILASERQEILTRLRRVKAAQPKAMAVPALPFFDWGACPYETCGYHQWTAHRSVTVYDTWKQARRPVAWLAKGDTVTGLTGLDITFKPGVIRLDRDLTSENLLRGDTILTYAYRGEGFSAVWFKDRYRTDFDITFAKWPDGTGCGGAHCAATYVDLGRKLWWAKVKLKSGRIGWVEMDLAHIPVSLY